MWFWNVFPNLKISILILILLLSSKSVYVTNNSVVSSRAEYHPHTSEGRHLQRRPFYGVEQEPGPGSHCWVDVLHSRQEAAEGVCQRILQQMVFRHWVNIQKSTNYSHFFHCNVKAENKKNWHLFRQSKNCPTEIRVTLGPHALTLNTKRKR